jgi:uncharacterized protein YijF (DUF1287 family)
MKSTWRRAALKPVLVVTMLLLPQASLPSGPGMSPAYAKRLIAAAVEQTRSTVIYDSAYRKIAYPGGDVPETRGVCADVVIRAYRKLGVDLQVRVHEDMMRDFSAYPHRWGLTAPDPNIDHRRVPNLQTFFRRAGAELHVSKNPDDYQPGDLVTWSVPPHLPHIGMVIDRKSPEGVPLIVHNIGRGPEIADMLFAYPITGHYRYSAE